MKAKKWIAMFCAALITLVVFAACTPAPTAGDAAAPAGSNAGTPEGTSAPGDAGNYPSKPIQLIVPVKAGGDTDTNARIFAKYLSDEIGQSVVVVNTEGGAGATGTKSVMDSKPDGLTVLFFHTESLLPKISGMVDYDLFDLKMCGIALTDNTTVLATHKDAGFTTMDEFVTMAKADPGTLQFGMATGGYPHLIGLAVEDAAGVEMNIVDVGGNSDKTVALLGHKIQLINTQYGLTQDYFTNEDFVCLGLLSEERNPLLADIPTLKEQGYDLVFNKAFFAAMPQDTPDAVRDAFSAAMQRVCENPAYIEEMAQYYIEANYMDPGAATAYMQGVLETFKPHSEKMKESVR